MQTFAPYGDPHAVARVLDRGRLGKQRVECLQILNTFAILPMASGPPKVSAGCRLFTLSEARDHWTRSRGGTLLGDETMAILDHLERVGRMRGIVTEGGE